ncbi:nucleoside-diphosphate sugar epimerase/dehydratase, partial [Archangium sp.]|uniref:nucleoside-diphosphate sugar epimerase/dehydratase n=1 Tax=Archangium sp. TaxID=1872627 RepID=UPI002F032314
METTSSHGRLAPGSASKLNLVVDVLLGLGALVGSMELMGHPLQPGNLDVWLLAGLGALTWLLVGTALCLYDPRFSDRSVLDDLALLSIAVVVTTGVLFLACLLLASSVPTAALSLFAVLLWTAVVGPRLLLFRRLARREAPLDEALVLGLGALGRVTGEELTAHGRRRVAGYLAFSGEQPAPGSSLPVLGRVEQLEEVLGTVPVDVVYIAGNAQKHAQEMQAAIKQCERFGIPFALPLHSFRMERARPMGAPTAGDGYLHFVTHA